MREPKKQRVVPDPSRFLRRVGVLSWPHVVIPSDRREPRDLSSITTVRETQRRLALCFSRHHKYLFSSILFTYLFTEILHSPMRVRKLTLREIHLKLLAPFETSFGKTELRRIVLVEADVDGISGWGESTAGEGPFYSYETADTAWLILRDLPLAHGERQGILVRVRNRGIFSRPSAATTWPRPRSKQPCGMRKRSIGICR